MIELESIAGREEDAPLNLHGIHDLIRCALSLLSGEETGNICAPDALPENL